MAGGDGFAGTVFFKRQEIVLGLRDAFDQLWNTSTPLFSGSIHATEEQRQALKRKVDSAIESRKFRGQYIQLTVGVVTIE